MLTRSPGLSTADSLTRSVASLAYGTPERPAPPTGRPVHLEVDLARVRSHVDPRFLSLALDTSQVLGGHWWTRGAQRIEVGRGSHAVTPFPLDDARLAALAAPLAPAYLRVGGTEADVVYYDMGAEPSPRPSGFDLTLSRARWDAIGRFVDRAGYDLFFTVNAGSGARDEDGRWSPANFEALLGYARGAGTHVGVFELGNEVDSFWFTQGLRHRVDGATYAQDLARFRSIVRGAYPQAKVAGPASLYWPSVGSAPTPFPGFLGEFLASPADKPDIVTWHYYPQQSDRSLVATRRASPTALLDPTALDELARLGSVVQGAVTDHAPNTEVWIGETGNALCGGQPGVSDRFAGTLWWLDELGLAARTGQKVVVRQTLAGSEYGLLDDRTFEPRPDYWASVLWKRLMGTEVLDVRASADDAYVRSYAHCAPAEPGGVTLLLVNLHPSNAARVCLGDLPVDGAGVYALSAPSLDSQRVLLNGAPLAFAGDQLPALPSVPAALHDGCMELAPASVVFVAMPAAGAAACKSATSP